jgi:hypothetical protein
MTQNEEVALLQLLRDLQGGIFEKALTEALATQHQTLQSAKDEISVRWAQGKAQYIQDLLREIATARDQLTKLGSRRSDAHKSF